LPRDPKAGTLKKIYRAGGGARTKRAEVARRWACHMDDCTRFELPGSPDTLRMRQIPDDQTHSRLPRGKSDTPRARSIMHPWHQEIHDENSAGTIHMTTSDPQSVAQTLVAEGKGILAADETIPTLTRRFDTLGIRSTEESRRTYREMLFTSPGAAEFISGVIMHDETIRSKGFRWPTAGRNSHGPGRRSRHQGRYRCEASCRLSWRRRNGYRGA
jgi:hypothetical protein